METKFKYDYSRGSNETADFSKSCIHCHAIHTFTLSIKDYDKIFLERQFMQDIFPELSSSQREVMISGTCPSCWDEIFG